MRKTSDDWHVRVQDDEPAGYPVRIISIQGSVSAESWQRHRRDHQDQTPAKAKQYWAMELKRMAERPSDITAAKELLRQGYSMTECARMMRMSTDSFRYLLYQKYSP